MREFIKFNDCFCHRSRFNTCDWFYINFVWNGLKSAKNGEFCYNEVSPRQMKNRDPWLYWAVSRGIGKSKKNWMPIFKHFILISPIYRVTMYTTVVPDSLGGRGVAKLLADEAFDFAVKEQVLLKPCWVIWIDHHDHMQIFKPSWCYHFKPDIKYLYRWGWSWHAGIYLATWKGTQELMLVNCC